MHDASSYKRAGIRPPHLGAHVTTSNPALAVKQRLEQYMPKIGSRTQMVAAASMWLIGASILLTRGVGYVHDRHWHAWALAAGLVLGVAKSQLLLDDVGRRAVERIRARGRGSALSFFSLKSWGLIAVMMFGGIMLRQLFVHPGQIGAGVLGALYIGVGSALLLADRIFWHAVFSD